MLVHLNKKAQSTLEYAVLIAIVVGALIAMQVYIKRGIQGRWKQASDDIGEQFSPGYTVGTYSSNSSVHSNETITGGGLNSAIMPSTYTNTFQNQNRSVSENVMNASNEYWGN